MDDDYGFGPSVWGAPDDPPIAHISALSTETPPPATPVIAELERDSEATAPDGTGEFDDFDDFGAPATAAAQDDDFGDFGDFGDAQDTNFADSSTFDEPPIAGPSRIPLEPLRLKPMPSPEDLREQVERIVAPIWAEDDIGAVTTNEEIRQAEGISQILLSADTRDYYNSVFQGPPPMKPPNWTRSRIRRLHLVALGIPVNLDEVYGNSNGKAALPPLEITTRPSSAPPGPRQPQHSSKSASTVNNSRVGTPRNGSPQRGNVTAHQLGLGPKPELDNAKISKLLELNPDSLTLLPLAKLEQHVVDIHEQTANTSALLTYLLQHREALQQDSETYNGLIAELVGEAQKMKTGRKPPTKRGSGMM